MIVLKHILCPIAVALIGILLIRPVYGQFAGNYTFTSVATGKVLDGDTGRLYPLESNGGANQAWLVEPTDVQVRGTRTFTIRSKATGKCLDGDGGRIYPSDCNGGNFQKWLLESTETDGVVWITSVATGKCLDGNTEALYPGQRNGGDYQKWRIQRVGQPQIGRAVSTVVPMRTEAPPAYSTNSNGQRRFNRNTDFFLSRGFLSNNGRYLVQMQRDGNFVVKRLETRQGTARKEMSILWSTNTTNREVAYATFQADGNLVL